MWPTSGKEPVVSSKVAVVMADYCRQIPIIAMNANAFEEDKALNKNNI